MISTFPELIAYADREPFEFGSLDCCQFAGLAIEIKSGSNPMRQLDYTGNDGAESVIESYGGLFSAICNFLGDPCRPEGGTDGDVLLGELHNGEAIVGIQYKNKMIVKTEKSVCDWPLSRALYRWEICQRQ